MQDCPGYPPQARSPGGVGKTLLRIAVGLGLCFLVPCVGLLAWAVYSRSDRPKTSLYAGNEVPLRYADAIRDVSALESGENILFFYCDTPQDIRRGFCLVSNRGVTVYSGPTERLPLVKIPFERIEDADLTRDEAFCADSEITLQLKDERLVRFGVSPQGDEDERFFEAILNGMSKAARRFEAEEDEGASTAARPASPEAGETAD